MIKIPQDIKNLLEKSIVAFGTCDKSGKPNVVAVACCKVVTANQVLITDNFFNKTRANLLANDQVSLAFWEPVDNSAGNQGFQLKGTAEYLTQGPWKVIVDADPDNEGLAHKGAVLVTISEIWDLAQPKLIASENLLISNQSNS